MIATRPPGARQCGKRSQQRVERAENSSFTAMRSAWNVRRTDIFTSVFASCGSALTSPVRTTRSTACVVVERPLLQQTGNEPCVRFVGVLGEQRRELLLAQPREQLRRGFTMRWIHPHVEGTGLLVTEAAIRVVDLHRRHPEVRKDQVGGREALRGEHLRQGQRSCPGARRTCRRRSRRRADVLPCEAIRADRRRVR